MTSTAIAAIPVYYGGTRYRSKLEGRWAAFLDVAGIAFTYEGAEFKLADGRYYTPDFWLPTVNRHIEIKPWMPTFAGAWMKCIRLQQQTGDPCLLIGGEPWLDKHVVRLWSDKEQRAFRGVFARCGACPGLHLSGDDWHTPFDCFCGTDRPPYPETTIDLFIKAKERFDGR